MPYITDFSPRPKGFNTPSSRESFDSTAGELLKRAEIVCRHLLPRGRREGNEYKAGDLYGAKGDSLSINVKTGVWKDFATDDGGGDLISLWAAVKGVRMIEAKDEAETWLGRAPSPPAPKTTDWTKLAPRVSAEDLKEAGKLPTPDKKWAYVTADGEVWCFVYRTEPRAPGERKRVRPVMPDEKREGKPEGLAPLLNLPDILCEQSATVVIVEGEKCADAISALKMIGVVATTHIGGTAGVAHTDWSPLKDRHVIRWPDKDAAGEKWMQTTAEELRKAGVASVRDVVPDPKWPDKHDAADLETKARLAVLDAVLRAKPETWLSISDSHFDVDWDDGEQPREYLIDNLFPFGRGGLLAAPGDTGKGMLILDLAVKVATPMAPGFDANPLMAFGRAVTKRGRVVILSAEDDRDELRRRLRAMHPNLPPEIRSRIHFLPYPDMPKRMPHYLRDNHGKIEETAEYQAIVSELTALKDLALVVLDPISAFFYLDMTTNAASQVVGNTIDKLAKTLGCTVLGSHHLTKGDRKTPINSPADARHAIQGGGQLLNAIRFAYALWAPPEDKQHRDLAKVGRKFEHNIVFKGAIVKANYPASRDVITMIRNQNGLLEVPRYEPKEPEEKIFGIPVKTVTMIEFAIKHFADTGHPATLGDIACETNARGRKGARGEWYTLMPARWRSEKFTDAERVGIINKLIREKRVEFTDGFLHMPGDGWGKGKDLHHDRINGKPDAVPWFDEDDL
jgi:hypothetical protein